MLHKAWSNMEELPYCFLRSYVKLQGHTGQKIADFDSNWAFLDCNLSLNSPMALKWCTNLNVVLFFKVIHQIPRPGIKWMQHLMLCVFLSRVCWLPKRGPTQVLFWLCTYAYIWTSSSCSSSSSSSCVHSGHQGLYRVIWLSFNANNSPFWGKELNQSDTFSKQLSTGFCLRIRIGIASRGIVHCP